MHNIVAVWHKQESRIISIVGIISAILPLVVPMSYIFMGICFLVLALCVAWLVFIFFPALPNRSRTIRNIAVLVVFLLISMPGGYYSVYDQWKKDHPPPPAKSPLETIRQPTAKEIADEILKKIPMQSQRNEQAKNNQPIGTIVQSARPWLEAVVKIRGPLIITKKEFKLDLNIYIINQGNAPSTDIFPLVQMAIMPIPVKDYHDLETAVKKASLRTDDLIRGGSLGINPVPLFPTRALEYSTSATFPITEISVTSQESKQGLYIEVGGCVSYRFLGGIGMTTFDYGLRIKDIFFLSYNQLLPRTIPAEDIFLFPASGSSVK